jgi:hypothetical protein
MLGGTFNNQAAAQQLSNLHSFLPSSLIDLGTLDMWGRSAVQALLANSTPV